MKHKTRQYISLILVFCITLVCMPKLIWARNQEEVVISNQEEERTTKQLLGYNWQEQKSYIYWNPHSERELAPDGYTTIEAGDDNNSGLSRQSPVLSLEKAIEQADENDVICCMNPYIVTDTITVDGHNKSLKIIRDESHTGNIFQINPSVTLTLKNITLDGSNTIDSPVITITEEGRLAIDEEVYLVGDNTYIALEKDAKPIAFQVIPSSRYGIYQHFIEEGDILVQAQAAQVDPTNYINLKNDLKIGEGTLEVYIEDYCLKVRRPTSELVTTIYISETGSDDNGGITAEEPVRTFEKAQDLMKSYPLATSITLCSKLNISDTLYLKDLILLSQCDDGFFDVSKEGQLTLDNVTLRGQTTSEDILNSQGNLNILGTSVVKGVISSSGPLKLDSSVVLDGDIKLCNNQYPLELDGKPLEKINLVIQGFKVHDTVVKGKDLSEDDLKIFIIGGEKLYFDPSNHELKLDYSGKIYIANHIGDDNNDGLTNETPVKTLEKAIEIASYLKLKKICIMQSPVVVLQDCKIPSNLQIERSSDYAGKLIEIKEGATLEIEDSVKLYGGILIREGILNMRKATLTNTKGVGVEVLSNNTFKNEFNLFGGTITECNTHAVEVGYKGYFNMHGGTIKNSKAKDGNGLRIYGHMYLDGKSEIKDVIYLADKTCPLILGENLQYPDNPYQIGCSFEYIGDLERPLVIGNEKVPATTKYFERAINMQATGIFNDTYIPYCIVVEETESQKAIYINGDNEKSKVGLAAGDDSNDGMSIKTPVKTFKRAYEILTDGEHDGLDIIVCGTLSVTDDQIWSLKDTGSRLVRYHSFNEVLIKIEGGNLTLKDIIIEGNSAHNEGTIKPAVHLNEGTLIMDEGAVIQNNNNISSHGGGIYQGNGTTLIMKKNAKIINNSTVGQGGGIYQQNNQLTMYHNAVITKNEAQGDGGGIYQDQSSMILNDCASILNNLSGDQGGGVYQCVNNNSLILSDESSIAYNTSKNQGGGIYTNNKCEIALEDSSRIEANQASSGGGVFQNSGSYIQMKVSSTITGNSATEGAGIYIANDTSDSVAKLEIKDKASIHHNVANKNGGGIYQSGGIFTVQDTGNINENKADISGGGIYSKKGKITISGNASIVQNTAQKGGGIYCNCNILSMQGGYITDNIASDLGSGIYIDKNTCEVTLSEGTIGKNTDPNKSQIHIKKAGILNIAKGGTLVQGLIYIEDKGCIQITKTIVYPKCMYTLACQNEVGGNVLVTSGGSVADASQYLNNFSIMTTKGIVLTKKNKNIVTSQVYFVDGVNGKDTNSGSTPKDALKTIEKGLEIIGKREGVIYITNTVTIKKDTIWQMHDNVQIYRYTGQRIIDTSYEAFTGHMIEVIDGNLTIVDGSIYGQRSISENLKVEGNIIHVASGSLNLQGQTYIADNVTSRGNEVIMLAGQLHISGKVGLQGTVFIQDTQPILMSQDAKLMIPLKVNIERPVCNQIILQYEDGFQNNEKDFKLDEILQDNWRLKQRNHQIILQAKIYVYIDGVNGKDTNSGISPLLPVKTIEKAQEIAQVEETRDIYIMDTVIIVKDTKLGPYQYMRYKTHDKALIEIQQGRLTLEETVLTGANLTSQSPLINIMPQGTVVLKDKTCLIDNQVGAIYNDGHLILQDSEVIIEDDIILEKGKYITAKVHHLEQYFKLKMKTPHKGDVLVQYELPITNEVLSTYSLDEDTRCAYTLDILDHNIILDTLYTVYVDGLKGDDSHSGHKNEPVATLRKAYSLLEETGGTIYIEDTVCIKDTISLSETHYKDSLQTIDITEGKIAIKSESQSALMAINNTGNLSLENITIDGQLIERKVPLLAVEKDGILIIDKGTILKNNKNSHQGGAVYNQGIVMLLGGQILNCTAVQGAAIYNTGRVQLLGGQLNFGLADVYLADETYLEVLKSLEKMIPIVLDIAAPQVGQLVVNFSEGAYVGDIWGAIDYFITSPDISLVKKGGTNHQLVIGGEFDFTQEPKDVFKAIGETATFIVKLNENIPVEESVAYLYDDQGTQVLDAKLIEDKTNNTLSITLPVTTENVGGYTLRCKYGDTSVTTQFTLSAYEIVYQKSQSTLIVQAPLYQDEVILQIYSGYKTTSQLILEEKSIEFISKPYNLPTDQLQLSTDITEKSMLQDKESFTIGLRSRDKITSAEGGIISLVLQLKPLDRQDIKMSISIPFKTQITTDVITNPSDDTNFNIDSNTDFNTEIQASDYINSNIQTIKRIPYYIINEEDVIIGFSADFNGKLQYIAPKEQEIYLKNNKKYFSDIKGHWSERHIEFVTEREIFLGTDEIQFSPNQNITRGMFITVIGRLYEESYGQISDVKSSDFTDVAIDSYYSKYIAWGRVNGIIKGIGNNCFAPDLSITREEIATILYNFTKFMNVTVNTAPIDFVDRDQIHTWAMEAILYCKANGMLEGNELYQLNPRQFATRAEVAKVMHRYIVTILKQTEDKIQLKI